jgi:hypothetical protein
MAGVEYGKECFCGNMFVDPAGPLIAPATECNSECEKLRYWFVCLTIPVPVVPCDTGDGTCGAGDRIQIYRNTAVIETVLPPKWKQVSACAQDSSDRLFEDASHMDAGDHIDPAYCAAYCADYRFTMAGVEYGTECWCGHGFKSPLIERPMSECAMRCNDYPGLTCGGPDRIQVYGLEE